MIFGQPYYGNWNQNHMMLELKSEKELTFFGYAGILLSTTIKRFGEPGLGEATRAKCS